MTTDSAAPKCVHDVSREIAQKIHEYYFGIPGYMGNGINYPMEIVKEIISMRQCPSCGGFCKKSGCERANEALSAKLGRQDDRMLLVRLKEIRRHARCYLDFKAENPDEVIDRIHTFTAALIEELTK